MPEPRSGATRQFQAFGALQFPDILSAARSMRIGAHWSAPASSGFPKFPLFGGPLTTTCLP